MADLGFGGRVLAGEDSEEDEEGEEEFQFGRQTAPAPVAAAPAVQPKFSVQAPVAGAEEDESDEEEDGEGEQAPHSENVESDGHVDTSHTPERTPRVSIDSSARSISRPTTPELPLRLHASQLGSHRDAYEEEWVTDGSVDGIAMMGHSIVQKLQPSLDSTIQRIAELTDSQQRLLTLLKDQRKDICSNDRIENVAIVMSKLPQYIKKVQDMKAAMVDISSSVDRIKKRSESLRVDAQSHAIKKENKRESLNQWNKLYAAKSFEGATMSAAISSSFSAPPEQPPPQ